VSSFLFSAIVLAAFVATGIAVIVKIRSHYRDADADRGDLGRGHWENALVGYKNLRDKGVLSDEEYRKIRTLVEPHLQKSDSGGGQPPPDPAAERRAE
jgi:hypothetical protein